MASDTVQISQLSAKGCDWCGDEVDCPVCKTCDEHCFAKRDHGFVDAWWEAPMPKDLGEIEGAVELWADAVFRTNQS